MVGYSVSDSTIFIFFYRDELTNGDWMKLMKNVSLYIMLIFSGYTFSVGTTFSHGINTRKMVPLLGAWAHELIPFFWISRAIVVLTRTRIAWFLSYVLNNNNQGVPTEILWLGLRRQTEWERERKRQRSRRADIDDEASTNAMGQRCLG